MHSMAKITTHQALSPTIKIIEEDTIDELFGSFDYIEGPIIIYIKFFEDYDLHILCAERRQSENKQIVI